MRVDDRLATALQNADSISDGAVVGKWRQLVDLLAQKPDGSQSDLIAMGLERVAHLGVELSADQRLEAIKALAGRIQSPPLIQLLSRDRPDVAAATIYGAHLSDDDWSELVPELPVRARGFLRSRRDLGNKTLLALNSWAGADFRIEGAVVPAAKVETLPQTESEIGALVRRIENWRRERENADSPRLPLGDEEFSQPAEPPREIGFETDDNGTIIWVDGVPRGAVVGADIACAAYDDGPGPDAYGAAAFRQRMPLENARLRLRGSPLIDGHWRMSAAPFFDALTGRFRGYRGILRRPTIAEMPEAMADDEALRQARGESMQQVVHELRTPLGAIAGFAEIIEHQLFGEVSEGYRKLASYILADANRLLAGFDDLSVAARLDAGNFIADDGVTECRWIAGKLAERLESISEDNRIELNLGFADPVRPFAIDNALAERIFSRLVSAVMMGCSTGEVLNGRFRTEHGPKSHNSFRLDLPSKLRSCGDEELFGTDPVELDVDESAMPASPLLGLGFSLRLVRNLARKVGGDLRFQKESLLLTLPAVQDGDLDYRDFGGD